MPDFCVRIGILKGAGHEEGRLTKARQERRSPDAAAAVPHFLIKHLPPLHHRLTGRGGLTLETKWNDNRGGRRLMMAKKKPMTLEDRVLELERQLDLPYYYHKETAHMLELLFTEVGMTAPKYPAGFVLNVPEEDREPKRKHPIALDERVTQLQRLMVKMAAAIIKDKAEDDSWLSTAMAAVINDLTPQL
jgi:hypothetical protein